MPWIPHLYYEHYQQYYTTPMRRRRRQQFICRFLASCCLAGLYIVFVQDTVIKQLETFYDNYNENLSSEICHDDEIKGTSGTSVSSIVIVPTTQPRPNMGLEILGEPIFRLKEIPTDTKFSTPIIISSMSGEFTQSNLNGCPDLNCKMVRGNDDKAEAVIFKFSGRPLKNRRHDQYYVFFSQESPMHTGGASGVAKDFYNLTMGYRRDATLPCPYGYTVKLRTPRMYTPMTTEQLANKTKPLAWLANMLLWEFRTGKRMMFVSNCHTPGQREKYVVRLKQYHPVDIYGGCGQFKCPKPAQRCNHKLKKSYRFYLAFENSICQDYLTEKLWNQGYQADVVPIVLKESLVKPYVPPGSYIAADQFSNVTHLAQYISYLMKNDSAYLEYFKWKENYDVVFLDGLTHDRFERPWGVCRLCALLRQEPRPQIIERDFQKWWNGPGVCDNGLVGRLK